MDELAQLVAYYQSLLIIQYNQQPNAKATIGLLATLALASNIIQQVENAFNITGDNIAVGAQLDIIGKYVGVDRFYSELSLTDYFALVGYSEAGALPSSPPRFGLSTYATFSAGDYNGTLLYGDIIAANNMLTDATFLTLIQFAIILNNSNFSYGTIANLLYEFFGTEIRAESLGNMTIEFFVSAALTPLIQAVIAKGLLPTPIGVGGLVVSNVEGLIFGMRSYSDVARGITSPYAYGFSTYSNYATLTGQTLSYVQITAG